MLYLDNAATTKINEEVFAEMKEVLSIYGNSEAKFYAQAEEAKTMISNARMKVAHIINADNPNEIIFTSGATEANNLVLQGTVLATKKDRKKIIVSSIEHSSIFDTCEYLKTRGVEIVYVPVDNKGLIDFNVLSNSIDENTILVSIIAVNNEIGTIQDLAKVNEICLNKGVYFHTDATQAIGKILLDVQKYQALKFVTFTAHKIYGPKGIGCLYVKNDENGLKTDILPILHGGEQEEKLRAGTLPNFLIAGFGKACEIAERDYEINNENYEKYEEVLVAKLKQKFGDKIIINNNWENRIKGLLSVRIVGYNNMILLKAISPVIAASAGSACSVTKPSRVLQQIGLSALHISESIRLSCSAYMDIRDFNEIDNL